MTGTLNGPVVARAPETDDTDDVSCPRLFVMTHVDRTPRCLHGYDVCTECHTCTCGRCTLPVVREIA